jgi:polar amino acid transport system substrate-binding protein
MRAIALVLALVLAVTACSSEEGTVSGERRVNAVPAMPQGAREVRSLPKPSVDTSCGNPEESYRPAGPLPAPGAPAGSTIAEIYKRGRLIVGVDQNTLGFASRNSDSGQIEGFALDIATEIARAIFGDTANRVQLTVLTSAQRIPAVKDGDVDLVVHSMTTNCERWKDVDFSAVFFEAGQKVLVKKNSGYQGLQSLAGKKVCATAKSTSLARIVNLDVTPKPIGMEVAGWTDCLVMLQQNQVYAVSTDDTILGGLAAQDPFTVVADGDPIAPEPYAIAIPKHQEPFVRFVNSVLEKIIADGIWQTSYNQWLQPLLHKDALPPIPQYRD